jgi:hypothetical protein
MTSVTEYQKFIGNRKQRTQGCGFDPVFMPDQSFGFQQHLIEWSTRMGRSAIFADCGLGKTLMQLAWAENVARHANGRVLILTPLAVAIQTEQEAAKFGIDVEHCTTGQPKRKSGLVVTNYEKLHLFDRDDFIGAVCDESSILKNMAGQRRKEITAFMRCMQYRLLCTATAAPNDFHELGTSSDALGYLGARDMLTKFFKEDTVKDYLGWGRKTYRFRGHAATHFWQWVASWARACRRPSDLGFDDAGYELPKLIEREELIQNSTPREGMLFSLPAVSLHEQREERRITINERCERAAQLAETHDGSSVIWCHLNDEADMVDRLLPDAEQVKGSMSDDAKQERLIAFSRGEIKQLVTKPKIGCFGLNWQHCHNVITFPSHSFEQYYQAVRRCYRFGQKKDVTVTLITTEGEQHIMKNLQRKAEQASQMFDSLVSHMNEAISVDRDIDHNQKQEIPSWL